MQKQREFESDLLVSRAGLGVGTSAENAQITDSTGDAKSMEAIEAPEVQLSGTPVVRDRRRPPFSLSMIGINGVLGARA